MSSSISKSPVTSAPSFACGIDIGTENLAISFVEISLGMEDDEQPRIISYKGTLNNVSRFEEGIEVTTISTAGMKLSPHDAYVFILNKIAEFAHTTYTIIELQLAYNHSVMSRLDGVAFGFLKGKFPTMEVSLNASTIRKKFISDCVSEEEAQSVFIPRGYPPTKQPSMLYVGAKHPSHYAFIQTMADIDKIDDICDSIVYASIAMLNYVVGRKRNGKR